MTACGVAVRRLASLVEMTVLMLGVCSATAGVKVYNETPQA